MRRKSLAFACALITIALIMSSAVPEGVGQSLTLQTVASLYRPVSVTLTSSGLILSYRYNDTSTILASLASNGTVRPFASNFSGSQEVYVAQAEGTAGFRTGDLFLCSNDSIYRMDSNGTDLRLFARPSPNSTVEDLNFDTDGSWGGVLFALTGDGGVWAINGTGGTSQITELGQDLMPEGITVAPSGFGGFGGDLLVSMERSHNVVAIPKANTSIHEVIATYPNQAPERVLIVQPDKDLLVAKYDLNIIVKISAGSLASYAGLPIVITEGEAGQAGSVSILRATGMNVTEVGLLNDSSSPHFEGAAFVPQSLLTTTTSGSTSSTSSTTFDTTGASSTGSSTSSNWLGYAVAGAVSVVIVSGILLWVFLRRRT